MAIDPIKARDQAYQAKRQALEEDRANEVDRIQKKHKNEVNTLREARGEEIKDIYEKQSEEISETQKRSKEKIENVKSGTSEQLRRHQEETAQLTSEAQKKLQSKANELSKYSKEIEDQRDKYTKRNEEAVKHLMENHAKNYKTEKEELQESQQKLYEQHNNKVRQLTENQNESLGEMRRTNQMNVQRERESQVQDARKLQTERDLVKASLAGQVEFERRKGQEQIEETKGGLQIARSKLEADNDESLLALARNNRGRVQQELIRGQREVDHTKSFYDDQIRDNQKAGGKQIFEAQEQKEKMLRHVKGEQDIEMHLANQSYLNKKHNFEESTTKTISEYDKNLKETKEKYTKDFQLQSAMMKDKYAKNFENDNQRLSAEIRAQEARGQKQLNDVKVAESVKFADHSKTASDPFYKLRQFDARVSDSEREWTMRIRVPAEEQDRIRVTGKQGQLSLTGSRRFEDKAKTDEGRQITTSSFQSFSEVIPISGTPDITRLTRTYEDGVLTVRIPKV